MMAERDPSQHAIGPLRHGHCLESVNRLYSFKSKWVGSRHGISVGPHDVTIKILCILRYSQAPLIGVLQSEIFE
jgi:hypothetical protein